IHWVTLKLHKDQRSFDGRMLDKLGAHYVLNFQDFLRYAEYKPLEGQSKWLSVQEKDVIGVERRVRGNPAEIKKLYKLRENELTSAISRVENSNSVGRFVYEAQGHVRVLVQ
ncbi:hypothetical protein C5167_051096, partial [Papaver somniferum]